ncbi:MAG: glycoside hydrolase family 2 TIM barrel-domain containing protein [Puniceicoccaceae bacterium]
MEDWAFSSGEITTVEEATRGEGSWQVVNLPHDWSISGMRLADAATSGGGGFFPSGTAWYRKSLAIPTHWSGQKFFLEFEGVMQSATVWINGHKVAHNHNGYLPFTAELTEHIEIGKPNIILVKVDTSEQPASRWYTGSGIYRPVRLVVTDPVRISEDGLFVTTMDIFQEAATLDVQIPVHNGTKTPVEAEVKAFIIDPEGIPVAQSTFSLSLEANETKVYNPRLAAPYPRLWSPDAPHLYRLVAHVFIDGRLADRDEATFGIRKINVSAEGGLRINDEPVLLVGANVHHDYGPLGAAVFEEAVQRKARGIKAAGFNAVRTAHNPPSTAFLEACDEIGLLVVDEAFDGWAAAKVKKDYSLYFEDHWQEDLRRFIRRDRNHPSVIMWSTGNEMYERGKAETVGLSRSMVALVKSLDRSRPVTAGINGLGQTRDWSDLDPLFATLDVAGYNYELERHAADTERVPGRVILASESYSTDAFRNLRIIQENTQVIGEFVWSGLDYLGEAGIGRNFESDESVRAHWEGSHFPWHGAACGEIDITGHRKPASFYRQLLWNSGTSLYLAVAATGSNGEPLQSSKWSVAPLEASWTWPGMEGKSLQVEVFSRYPLVRLFSGYDLVGEAATSMENGYRAVFTIPYEPGTLKAQGLEAGEVQETIELVTAGPPARLQLEAEKTQLTAGTGQIVYIDLRVLDAAGNPHPGAELSVTYGVDGPASIIGIANGNMGSEESYSANPRRTQKGRAQLVLRSTGEPGTVRVAAHSDDLESGSAVINFSQFPPRKPLKR